MTATSNTSSFSNALPSVLPPVSGADISALPEPLPLLPENSTVGGSDTGFVVGGGADELEQMSGCCIGNAIKAKPGTAAWQKTWPQWQKRFVELGMPELMIKAISNSMLDEEELARTYQRLAGKMIVAEPGTLPKTGGWSSQWEQMYKRLGLSNQEIERMGKTAQKRQSTDEQLSAAFRKLAKQFAKLPAVTDSVETAPSKGKGKVPNKKPTQSPTQSPTQKTGGKVDIARLEKLAQQYVDAGMPKEIVQFYAQTISDVSAQSSDIKNVENALKAALDTAASQWGEFEAAGWPDKFKKQGMDDLTIWRMALGDRAIGTEEIGIGGKPYSKKELDLQLVMMQRSKAGTGKQVAEAAFSLLPGVQAVEYLAGKNFISGSDIRKDDTLNKGLAIGSALLAVGAAIYGIKKGKSISAGLKAAKQGFANIVAATGKGVSAESSFSKVANTRFKTLKILNPFSNFRNDVVGVGKVDSAAGAFLANQSKLDPLSKNLVLDQFKSIASGEMKVSAKRIGMMPWSSSEAIKGTSDAVLFNTRLGGDGRTALAALVKQAGDSASANPEKYLTKLPSVAKEFSGLGAMHQSELGNAMARRSVEAMGGIGSKGKVASKLAKLSDMGAPQPWFESLTKAAASDTAAVSNAL